MPIVEHLIADTFGTHIGKYSERLKITQGDETLQQASLLHLKTVLVTSRGVSISADALPEQYGWPGRVGGRGRGGAAPGAAAGGRGLPHGDRHASTNGHRSASDQFELSLGTVPCVSQCTCARALTRRTPTNCTETATGITTCPPVVSRLANMSYGESGSCP
mgnify:CR=1 FL=1